MIFACLQLRLKPRSNYATRQRPLLIFVRCGMSASVFVFGMFCQANTLDRNARGEKCVLRVGLFTWLGQMYAAGLAGSSLLALPAV